MAKKITNADLFDSALFDDPIRKAEAFLTVIKEMETSIAKSMKDQQKMLKQFEKVGGLDNLRAARRAIDEVNLATKEMLKLKLEEAKLNAKLTAAKSEQAKANEQLKQSIKEQNKAIQEQVKSEKALLDLQKKEIKSIQDLQDRNNALIRTRKNLDLTTKQGIADYKKYTEEIRKNNTELKKHDAAVGSYVRNVGNYGSAIKGFGTQLLGILGAGSFLAVAQNAVEINAKFGQSLADLKVITGATDEQMKFFEKTALEQTKTLNGSTASATEYTEALKLIASAKPELLENAQALNEVTKQALILSDASGLDLPEASTKLTDAMNQFGAGADQAAKFVNVLAGSAKYGSAEIPQVTEALLEFGPVAKSYNISVAESAAAIEALAEKGIKGTEAGTKLRNIMLSLGAAKGLPKEAQESFKRVGIDVNILADNSLSLEARLAELSKAQNDEVAMLKIFGKENISAAKSVLAQKDRIAELTGKIDGYTKAGEDAEGRTQTLSGELKKLSNAWQTAMIEFGKGGGELASVIRFIRQNLDTIILVVTKLVKGFLVYKGTILAVNAAMKIGKVSSAAYASAMVAFGRSTEGATKSFKALDSTMKANVIGLVVTAVYELADALGFFETEADRVAKNMDQINEETAKTDEALGQRNEILNKNLEKLNQLKDEEIAIAQAKGESIDNINKKYNLKTKQILETEQNTVNNLRKKEKENFERYNQDVERLEAYLTEKKGKLTAHRAQTLGAELDDAKLKRKVAEQNFIKYRDQIIAIEDQLTQNRSEARIQQAQTLGEQTNDAKVASKEQIEAARRKADEIKRIEDDLRKWLEDLRVQNIESDRERELAAEDLAFQRQLETLNDKLKTLGKTSEEAKQIEEQLTIAHREKLDEINQKYDEKELDENLKDLEFKYKQREDYALKTIEDQEKLDEELLNLQIEQLKDEIEILEGNAVEKEKIIDKQIELDNLLRKQAEDNAKKRTEAEKTAQNAIKKAAEDTAEATKKAAEQAEQRTKDLITAAQTLSDELTNIFVEQSRKREEILDREIEASQQRQEELRAIAERGVAEADQSLAAEERKQAELERKKMEEQRKQQRIELANTAFKAYVGHVDNKDQSPLTSTIRDITALTAFIASLPAFFEGTENTGKGGDVDEKGGFHAILHPNERVMTADQNKELAGISNEEVVRIVRESKIIRSHSSDAVANMKLADKLASEMAWQSNERIVEKVDELIVELKNKPVPSWNGDAITKTIVETIKANGKVLKNHYKLPNINA